MARPSQTDGSMWRGESSQPAWNRLPGQVERSLNFRHDIAYGADSRSATRRVADIAAAGTGQYHVVQVRDAVFMIGANSIIGRRLTDGATIAVTDSTAAPPFNGYLAGITPLTDIETAVAFDTVIVVNRTKVTTSATSGDITAAFNAAGGVGAAAVAGGSPVADFSALPTAGMANGDAYFCEADYLNEPSGWYVWDTTATPDRWLHVGVPNDPEAEIVAANAPHRIVYNSGSLTATVTPCPWVPRKTGSQRSNPQPRFVGSAIRGVTFAQGRLMLFHADGVTCSRTNDFFNLYRRSVDTLSDDERIGLDLTISNAGRINRAEPCGEGVFVDCDTMQLGFGSGDDAMSSTTARFYAISDHASSDHQINGGGSSLAIVDRFLDVWRYDWDAGLRAIVETSWLNAQRIDALYGETVESTISLSPSTFVTLASGDLRVNDWYGSPDQPIQSAWGRIRLREAVEFACRWADKTYFMTRDATAGWSILSYVHRVPLTPADMLYEPQLDRMELRTGTFDATLQETTFVHTGRSGDLARTRLVLTTSGVQGKFVQPKRLNGSNNPVFAGDLSAGTHYLGFTFDSQLELSRKWPGPTKERPTITGLVVFVHKSTDFRLGFETDEGVNVCDPTQWDAKTFGATTFGAASVKSDAVAMRIPGSFDGTRMKLTISKDSPGRLTVTHVEYEVVGGGRG